MPEYNRKCTGCFWWESFACDGSADDSCDYEINVTDASYSYFHDRYEEEVEKALAPIHDNWRKLFRTYINKGSVPL